jgi:hypothetical protein
MNDQNFLKLVHQEIDGANSPGERAKLERRLAENPEAQNLFNDFQAMASALSEVKEIDPPPNLKKTILNSIRADRFTAKGKSPALFKWGFFESLAGAMASRASLKYALAVSLGLVGGVILYAAVDNAQKNGALDPADLYGTLVLEGGARRFDDSAYVHINLNQVRGSGVVKYSREAVVAELSFQTQQEIEFVLDVDERDLRFSSFAKSKSNGIHSSNISEGSIKLTQQGDNHYLIVFKNQLEITTPLRIKIYEAGSLLYETTVSPASPNR